MCTLTACLDLRYVKRQSEKRDAIAIAIATTATNKQLLCIIKSNLCSCFDRLAYFFSIRFRSVVDGRSYCQAKKSHGPFTRTSWKSTRTIDQGTRKNWRNTNNHHQQQQQQCRIIPQNEGQKISRKKSEMNANYHLIMQTWICIIIFLVFMRHIFYPLFIFIWRRVNALNTLCTMELLGVQ